MPSGEDSVLGLCPPRCEQAWHEQGNICLILAGGLAQEGPADGADMLHNKMCKYCQSTSKADAKVLEDLEVCWPLRRIPSCGCAICGMSRLGIDTAMLN